jgi:hypothetical protein
LIVRVVLVAANPFDGSFVWPSTWEEKDTGPSFGKLEIIRIGVVQRIRFRTEARRDDPKKQPCADSKK